MEKDHFSHQNKLFTPTLKKLILPKNKRILDWKESVQHMSYDRENK